MTTFLDRLFGTRRPSALPARPAPVRIGLRPIERAFFRNGATVTALGNAETELLRDDLPLQERVQLRRLTVDAIEAAAKEFVDIDVRVNGQRRYPYTNLNAWRTNDGRVALDLELRGGDVVRVVALNRSGSGGTFPPATDVKLSATLEGEYR